eukprot:scaffold22.g6120.t1
MLARALASGIRLGVVRRASRRPRSARWWRSTASESGGPAATPLAQQTRFEQLMQHARLTHIAQDLWELVLRPGDTAVDATAGNGYDSLFLARTVGAGGRLYVFDVQAAALDTTRRALEGGLAPGAAPCDRYLIHSSHEAMLPSTLRAIAAACEVLQPGGLLSVMAYTGHPGGQEEYEAVRDALAALPPAAWNTGQMQLLNRPTAPVLLLAWKKAAQVVPHEVLQLVYSRYPSLPAVNRGSRDARQSVITAATIDARHHDPRAVAVLRAMPRLARVALSGLYVGDCSNVTFIGIVWQLTDLPSLQHLDLSSNIVLPIWVEGLTALTGLQSLDFSDAILRAAGAEQLAGMTGLLRLNITNCAIGAEGTAALRHLTRLQHLAICMNELSAVDARNLASLTGLRRLDVSHNDDLSPEGARYLARLTGLQRLQIGNCGLCPTGAQHLARLTRLQHLEISSCALGPSSARHLTGLTALQHLSISNNSLGAGARYLAGLTLLTHLNVSSCSLGPAGAQPLAVLAGLQCLAIDDNILGEEGARCLTRLTPLRSLHIRRCALGPAGATHIAGMAGRLRYLSISGNNLGPEGSKALAAFPCVRNLTLLT